MIGVQRVLTVGAPSVRLRVGLKEVMAACSWRSRLEEKAVDARMERKNSRRWCDQWTRSEELQQT